MRRALAAIVVLLSCSTSHSQDWTWYQNQDGAWCGPEGSATSELGIALNRLKNRWSLPMAADVDPAVTLAALLASGDDRDRWDAARAATIAGWVIKVKKSGAEACNCGSNAAADTDTHIDIALSPDEEESINCVVVEVTPRLRAMMWEQGIDWRSSTLKKTDVGIKGKFVEFTGWLFRDDYHLHQAENTNPGGGSNFRATAWELHPVTSIRLLPSPPIPHSFRPPGAAARRRAIPNADVAAQSRALNDRLLAKFHSNEREEKYTERLEEPTFDEPPLPIRRPTPPTAPTQHPWLVSPTLPLHLYPCPSPPVVWFAPQPCGPPSYSPFLHQRCGRHLFPRRCR